MDADLLDQALETLTAEHAGLHGVLVLKGAGVIAEWHAPDQCADDKHIMNSCTKGWHKNNVALLSAKFSG